MTPESYPSCFHAKKKFPLFRSSLGILPPLFGCIQDGDFHDWFIPALLTVKSSTNKARLTDTMVERRGLVWEVTNMTLP